MINALTIGLPIILHITFAPPPPPHTHTPVHECLNLPPMDPNGLADPYVKLRMFPDNSSSAKQKTERKEKTLNPKFEEDFFL